MASGWPRTRSFNSDTSSPPLKRSKSDGFDVTSLLSTPPSKIQHQANHLEWKMFHDSVHGHIKLDPVLVTIIDTPQFQRLRDLKQLGASYWVYPGGCHNRFEHSIGTAHLCGIMIKTLAEVHARDIIITDVEKLCVQIAGLCHDLGHGPFSHVFDRKYIKLIQPDEMWTHEEASCDMFDFMIQENPQIVSILKERGCSVNEFELIKNMIRGKDPKKDTIDQVCVYNGIANVPKWFLYEIVNNKRSGIDVDKFDYFARDCHHTGTASNFDHQRFFQNIRILCIDNQLQICIRDKEFFNVYEMFHIRWSLHHRVYQHKTTRAIEQMIVEAMAKVDDYFGISSSIHDMPRYIHMSDSIIYDTMRIKDIHQTPKIKEAQALLKRVQKRDLFQFCGQVKVNSNDFNAVTSSRVCNNLETKDISAEIAATSSDLSESDLFVEILRIAFSMHDRDPADDLVFYNKEGKPLKLKKNQISELLPSNFKESYIRVYSRDSSKKALIEEGFQTWCSKKCIELPTLLVGDSQYFTNLYKPSAEKLIAINDRFVNLAQNPDVKRSIKFAKSEN